MGGTRYGILGTDPSSAQAASGGLDVLGDGDVPGSLGIDDTPLPPNLGGPPAIPLGVSRIIASVDKDWEPTQKPRTTPAIVLKGATLEQVGRELDRLNEWGEGGGMIRTDPVPSGTSTDLTIKMHANLVYRLPTWAGYEKASDAAKAAWDKMYRKLVAHEDRHVEIAVEEANQCAADLIGLDIDQIARTVTTANRRMAQRQTKLDTDTANGSKPGVQYGDVILDTSVP